MSIYSEFIQKIKSQGLSSPNRFRVFINLPSAPVTARQQQFEGVETTDFISDAGLAGGTDTNRTLSLLCENTQLPGKLISTLEAGIHGPVQKMPYIETYSDITLTFIVTNDMLPKKLFDAWQASIIDPVTRNINFYKEYVSTVEIEQLDREEKPIYKVRLLEAYPVAVEAMALDHNSVDQVHKLSVILAYRYWEPVTL